MIDMTNPVAMAEEIAKLRAENARLREALENMVTVSSCNAGVPKKQFAAWLQEADAAYPASGDNDWEKVRWLMFDRARAAIAKAKGKA